MYEFNFGIPVSLLFLATVCPLSSPCSEGQFCRPCWLCSRFCCVWTAPQPLWTAPQPTGTSDPVLVCSASSCPTALQLAGPVSLTDSILRVLLQLPGTGRAGEPSFPSRWMGVLLTSPLSYLSFTLDWAYGAGHGDYQLPGGLSKKFPTWSCRASSPGSLGGVGPRVSFS